MNTERQNNGRDADSCRTTGTASARRKLAAGYRFGLNDGLVTTLVFIMAASVVAQTHNALLLVALSEVTAGGVSMALGGFLSARTERDILEYRIATERHEIATEPDEERAELRTIYRRKGMSGNSWRAWWIIKRPRMSGGCERL